MAKLYILKARSNTALIRVLVKIILIFMAIKLAAGFSPNYYMLSINEQKVEFAKTISKLTKNANTQTLQKRAFALNYLKQIYQKSFRDIDVSNLKRLVSIQKEYKISNLFDESEYKLKLDSVPVSLAIAQATIESGWGKSRFAKEANNLFGHWTWGGKGLVPLNRDEDKMHKIKIFNSLDDSVNAYALNLNSHPAYAQFRDMRAIYREKGLIYDGLEAAKTMENYSQMGKTYVKQLEKTIKLYDLTKFDF
ncbi:glucosaminidase domain-containing protein [Campylobacter fetus]|uniref:Mannosyl-glycoprotein endo-beta-N-acetylglucosamidase n=2 Tax=Campylobacter fetus TaxID=196 RepID=A0A5L8K313_CAMFE|nr:mannosyl-glycoprotein endo-beta-N-acetylglucosamidase [Campylobacter fetus]EAI3915873.1 mannosyl-glycoprotein endo-beta-N-acetylglucosamidase [Campylobacter fetus]EAI3919271.1 mannosyl-glycoprotein endo-beta-N-acetylglucosamidase [Campylobacter fetus]EAI8858754.1 mannosyl-glycoprotein endo-beta-N-acetylglucosamidase [Campylobacter fetus]EAJ0321032.1 mannosyl-glycoprotein endo-beta-N-acetylglucosamidase [Campylobacter fetus]